MWGPASCQQTEAGSGWKSSLCAKRCLWWCLSVWILCLESVQFVPEWVFIFGFLIVMFLFFSHSVGLKAFLTQLATSVFCQMLFSPPLCFGIYLTVLVRINNVCLCLVLCCNVLHITKPLLKPHIFRCDDCVWFLQHSQGVARAHPQLLHTMSCCEFQLGYSLYIRSSAALKSHFFLSSLPIQG